MAKMVLGIFSSPDNANLVLDRLRDRGYNPKDISVIMRDTTSATGTTQTTGDRVAEGTVSGATTGGIIGALAGLLVGVGAIAIPGIGGILIGGPIAAALGLTGAAATTVSGAVTGALAGGLVGALVNLGVPQEDAVVYEEEIKKGSVLIAVPSTEDQVDEIREVMENNSAGKISTINTV